MPKLTKIIPGYYKASYEQIDFTVKEIHSFTDTLWTFVMPNYDHLNTYPTKDSAVQAAKSYIDSIIF